MGVPIGSAVRKEVMLSWDQGNSCTPTVGVPNVLPPPKKVYIHKKASNYTCNSLADRDLTDCDLAECDLSECDLAE